VVVICPACAKELPGDFPFCPFCGAALAGTAPSVASEERKVVSILFCDLVGFTAASNAQDPEDVRARIRPYHDLLRHELERYGATVEKFIGDAVVAVCGAPIAHEDDAERAVRAGLAILEAIVELNDSDPALDLRVRIGVNTGEAVVAVGARPDRGEGIVTGDVVNTAARIQSAAPVNAVAVGKQTYRLTSRVFEYEPLAPVVVKGKPAALQLWRAKAARARLGSDVGRRHTTPFVGRELERPLLIGIFERAAQQRCVQLVTVVGEPGVGKSRLVAELFGYIETKPELIRWRQGRCLPYGEGITFWALGEIVKAEAGILESDSARVAAAKLDGAVAGEERERPWLLQRLAPLVGLEAASTAEREELFAAWRRFLEGLAATHPTVLVFEDLHWADEALLSFLEYLAEWSQGVPLLILCAARPELYERRPAWGAGQRNAHTINLSPLSNRETIQLVSHLVDSAALSDDLERAILDRVGGNPLYAEEFVRLLGDRHLADGAAGISETELPDSVQALIAARLDTLSPERKSVLQSAAVLGKVFWIGGLEEMEERARSELEFTLHEFVRKELIRPTRASSMEGEAEYSFSHLLVRDVAYGQIARAERARRHRSAASWLERRAGERVEDVAEVLAYHYLQALDLARASGDTEQAAAVAEPARRFLALAGERALGLDTTQAEARLSRALELTPPDDAVRPSLMVRWADAAFQAGRSREAAAALDQAFAVLRERGEVEQAARALQLRSRVEQRLGGGRQVALAADAIQLLERESPHPTLVDGYTQLANVQHVRGDHEQAIAAADHATTLAATLRLPEPARALGYRGASRAYLGDVDGFVEMEHALALLLDRGAIRDAAILQNNLAIARYPLEGPAQSLADFEKAIAFCNERGLAGPAAQLEANCPGLVAELGRTDEALSRIERLAGPAEASGDTHVLIELRSVEVAIRLGRGDEEGARSAVDWLTDAARAINAADQLVLGLGAAAAALETTAPDATCALLAQLERGDGTNKTPYFARHLPALVRTALRASNPTLATRLTEALQQRHPLAVHARRMARAQLAEYTGNVAAAADSYAEAAAGWRAFGNVPERAQAHLGHGRCLLVLHRPLAEHPLGVARDLFATLGYTRPLAETVGLIEQTPPVRLS
jgi:class 3 adenylate cyclase/tetratricopeptide (TPR) repeat protein